VPVQLDVEVSGEITAHDVSIWELSALKGLFTDVTEDPVTYVNAPLLAKERGCESRLVTTATADDFRNVTTLVGTLADGTTVSVAGTLTGPKMVEKIVGVNGFDLEIPISDNMVFFSYVDRPGVIGCVGKLLGDADVNIAGMQVSRIDELGEALVALTVDSAIPEDVVTAIATEVGTETLRTVNLS
jgi:D-3-phosphoglycerate dehydrogenase